ncbi:MAG: hypothetical protein ACT4TC_06230 [Myxococcaceae bacterium]
MIGREWPTLEALVDALTLLCQEMAEPSKKALVQLEGNPRRYLATLDAKRGYISSHWR